jgi:hypothetical protein
MFPRATRARFLVLFSRYHHRQRYSYSRLLDVACQYTEELRNAAERVAPIDVAWSQDGIIERMSVMMSCSS